MRIPTSGGEPTEVLTHVATFTATADGAYVVAGRGEPGGPWATELGHVDVAGNYTSIAVVPNPSAQIPLELLRDGERLYFIMGAKAFAVLPDKFLVELTRSGS